MTADDQYFLDTLSGISKDIRNFTGEIADATDRHIEAVASSIRDTLISANWFPAAAKPSSRHLPRPALPEGSFWDRATIWVSRNRALAYAIASFVVTGGVTLLIVRRSRRRRRAKRAVNGARKEVVVLAGPPHSPLTKTLELDLERKGFIVYVLVSSKEEEEIVKRGERIDVKPLWFDVSEPSENNGAVAQLNSLFSTSTAHPLTFTGLILAPDLVYPTGPVEGITPDLWSDALNAKVLNTVATTQALLPTVLEQKARIIVLTPSIVSSLRPALHSVQSAVIGALEGYTASLSSEMIKEGVHVTQIRMGAIDFNNSSTSGKATARDSVRAHWARSPQRITFPSNGATTLADCVNFGRGSPLRDLHLAVLDALIQPRPRSVVRVGRGSLAYEILGRFAPRGLVGWMVSGRRSAAAEPSISQPSSLENSEHWEEVAPAAA